MAGTTPLGDLDTLTRLGGPCALWLPCPSLSGSRLHGGWRLGLAPIECLEVPDQPLYHDTGPEARDHRFLKLERVMGFEPTTLCLGSRYSATELHPPGAVQLY